MTAGTAGELLATVEGIDHSTGMLSLRATDGHRMELMVPEELLAGLQAGDHVQVTIHKIPGTLERSPSGSGERPPSEPTR
jgi:hypothetical protein